MASLPLEEEPPGGFVRQAGLVVPHQVPAHESTVVPRVQRGVEEEGVILRSEGQNATKAFFFLWGPKIQIPQFKSRKNHQAGRSHVFSEEAVSLLLYEGHVVSEPGPGGPQHVFPPQHQNAQALAFQLRHHRQQLMQTNTSGFTHSQLFGWRT